MHVPARSSLLVLLLGLGCAGGCNGASSDDGDGATTMGTTTLGTTGPGSTGDATATTGTTQEPPGDTTEQPPGTTSTSDPTTDDSGSDTTDGGAPGDWLLTVDRGSAPPRLMKIALTGGAVEVCALAAAVDYASIVFARDGTLYGLDATTNRIDVINPCNCSFQLVGPTSLGPVALGLADNDQELLGIDPALDALVRIDLDTGLGTVVGPLGFMFGSAALSWANALALPYAIEADNDYLYTVAPPTGTATPGQLLSQDLSAPGLAVHPNGVLYACDGNAFYTIDPGSGLMTPVGPPLGLTGGCQTLTPPQTAVACIDAL
ncbi:MAG: hypothetical protein KDK70_05760 [Myxococcales bacterium]|nr:hypothetical protein [Myxococcales bacterium]